MRLTKQAVELCEKNKGGVLNLLAVKWKRSESTIRRWFNPEEMNPLLTHPESVDIIRRQTGLSIKEILTNN